MQSPANAAERFLVLNDLGWRFAVGELHDLLPKKRFDLAPPGAALNVAGGVEADPEDPGPHVLNLGQALLGPPAAEEYFLGDLLSVVGVAEQKPEGAHQLVADLGEGAQKHIRGRHPVPHGSRRSWRSLPSRDARNRFAHTATYQTREWAFGLLEERKRSPVSLPREARQVNGWCKRGSGVTTREAAVPGGGGNRILPDRPGHYRGK